MTTIFFQPKNRAVKSSDQLTNRARLHKLIFSIAKSLCLTGLRQLRRPKWHRAKRLECKNGGDINNKELVSRNNERVVLILLLKNP